MSHYVKKDEGKSDPLGEPIKKKKKDIVRKFVN